MTTRSRSVLMVASLACVLAIGVIAVSADAVRTALDGAYTYPNQDGLTLAEAASMTMTYLFVLTGVGLVMSVLYRLPRLGASAAAWWIGVAIAVIGTAAAVYNTTQTFPLAVKLVMFLPALAGLVWASVSRPDHSA